MNIRGTIYSYEAYMKWVHTLVQERKTSGSNQGAGRISYTALNLKRMIRLNRIMTEKIMESSWSSITESQLWVVIAEPWCGDCAQILPAIDKMVQESQGMIELQIILRDENPEWIEKYHTNGAKSIPKLISFNRYGEELFTWGPRPAPAQELLLNWKDNHSGKSWNDFEGELHTWYARDKAETVRNEFDGILAYYSEIFFVGDFH